MCLWTRKSKALNPEPSPFTPKPQTPTIPLSPLSLSLSLSCRSCVSRVCLSLVSLVCLVSHLCPLSTLHSPLSLSCSLSPLSISLHPLSVSHTLSTSPGLEHVFVDKKERLTRGTVTSTMRRAAHPSGCARCGAGAGCSVIKNTNLISLYRVGARVRGQENGLRQRRGGLPQTLERESSLLTTYWSEST